MSESRAVPSGKVYRQLFEAQVQLSRSLLAGRRDTRTDCLSAEDSNTHCSTTSSRRQQQVDDDDDDVDDVSRLPDSVDRQRSDVIERLTEKRSKKHKEALKQLETELTHLSQVCETQVRTVSLDLLSSLQDVDLHLNILKDRMEHLEHVAMQEVSALWEEIEEEVKIKKTRIMELNLKLTAVETQRTDEIRVLLRKYLHLLERISFLTPPDVYRLIHSKATMLNQSLLANRRSTARLQLLLQEKTLQHESLLRLHWEACLSRWRRSRVTEAVDRFRSFCSSNVEQQLVPGQLVSGQMVPGQLVSGQMVPGLLVSGQMVQEMKRAVTERDDIISQLCSLVPPSCSHSLVSDWFNQLTAVNQQIECLHADFLHQLHCCYEQTWQSRLAEVERCKEALLALQLPEEEVNDVVSSQLLTLIGQRQSQEGERLAALDLWCDSVARHAVSLSRCAFVVMRDAALLWETHNCLLQKREEELQQHLDELRRSQQQHTQREKLRLDGLLAGLRQESSEDTLKRSLDKTVQCLQDVKHSSRQCVSDQWEVLDRLPSLLQGELRSYSSSLSSFYHLSHTYTLSPEELQTLYPSCTWPETSEGAELQSPEERTDSHDVDPHLPSQVESSLLELCDINSDVTFTSSKGVVYSGPTFRCPAPDLQQETHLSLFPVELLTHSLSRTRTLFLDHLEQHFQDVLDSAVAMVTDRKEAVCSEQELQLQQLNIEHIQTHIYQPRLAELQLHRRQVDVHCEEVSDMLSSCRVELQELQTSISRMNQELIVRLSTMEEDVLSAASIQRLEAVSSTLQDCLEQHIKHTQRCQTSFRKTVHIRLEEVRHRTTQLLNSFRLFSEGGDFAPQEVKQFQRRLKEDTKQMSVVEESLHSELELLESSSLQQVKEASTQLEDKLSVLKSELLFMEKIQKIIRSTQVHIKAEAASSNQQQSSISSRLEDLRRMMENTQVSPDQVFSFLPSLSEEVRKRCQYLDCPMDPTLEENLTAYPGSRKQVQSTPPPGLLQTSRRGVELLNVPVVGIIKSLNRVCVVQDAAAESVEEEERGKPPGQSPVQRLHQKSASTLGVRRSCRSIRTERRFRVFGPEPEQNPHSFSSLLNSVLWRANDVLLQVAEDFYRSECLSSFLLLPNSLDQWAESMQQRLLGYQEQTRTLLSMSREELETQLHVLGELLHSLPAVLISNHEQQWEAGLTEEVGGVRLKLDEMLAASELDKLVNVRQLRVSLRDDELQTLNSREELRQQELHSAICCIHLELQACVRDRGEEFVTSLGSLTEQLLSQLDELLSPEETEGAQHSEVIPISMEAGAETGQKHGTVSRTWSGIPYLSPSSVTVATTASITTTRTLRHLAVIEQRDGAVKRFQQLVGSELSRSDNNKQRRLSELQSWNTHWRQQIHTLIHTH